MKNLKCLTLLVALATALSLHAESQPAPTPESDYPLETCVVSGQKLGSMGDPYIHHTEEGREVRFCCKHCLPKFKKNPELYLKKLEAAKAAKPESDGSHSGHNHASH